MFDFDYFVSQLSRSEVKRSEVKCTIIQKNMSARLFSGRTRPLFRNPVGVRCLHHGTPKDTLIDIPVEDQLPKRAKVRESCNFQYYGEIIIDILQVVIAGSGLIGNSIAYHLAKSPGWEDVVIVDRGNIADGTSKYGSGMLGMFRPSHERKIVQYSMQLYRKMQEQVNQLI